MFVDVGMVDGLVREVWWLVFIPVPSLHFLNAFFYTRVCALQFHAREVGVYANGNGRQYTT